MPVHAPVHAKRLGRAIAVTLRNACHSDCEYLRGTVLDLPAAGDLREGHPPVYVRTYIAAAAVR